MNIKLIIACMALMISTGYSSLMSVDEFESNLNNAINTTKYPFKDMGSKELGLNESFEYYRVVERFVAAHFNQNNQELLSLAIASGKFGVNTDFMWMLYNMASMGILRVEGVDEGYYGRRSFIRRKNSEEIIEIPVIKEDKHEEIVTDAALQKNNPVIEAVITEEKPKDFKTLVDKMLADEKYFNNFILEAKTQSDLEYLKHIRPIVLEKNFKVRINYDTTFSRDYMFLTQYQYIDLTANYFDQLIKEQENLLLIYNPKFKDKEQETALTLSSKVKESVEKYNDYFGLEFCKQLKPLTIEELELMQNHTEYTQYFVGCNIYKYTDKNCEMAKLTKEVFKKSIHTAINGLKILELFNDENIKNKIKNNNEYILRFIVHKDSVDYFSHLLSNFSTKELIIFYKHKKDILSYEFLTSKGYAFLTREEKEPSNVFDKLVSDRLKEIAKDKNTTVVDITIMKENFADLISKNKDLKDEIEGKKS